MIKDMDWYLFEKLAIDNCRIDYPSLISYRWTEIPHTWLLQSGYINSYNEARLKRLIEKNKKIGEYGLDGMSFDPNNIIYRGLQFKYSDGNKTLNTNDLGTFLHVINDMKDKNIHNRGILYTNRNVSKNGLGSLVKLFDYKYLKYNNHIDSDDPDEIYDEEYKDFKLYAYQSRFLEKSKDLGKGMILLKVMCGGGKTEMMLSHLESKSYKLIILCAPLKVTVDNLYNRFNIKGYKKIRVDSDGSTDRDKLINDLDGKCAAVFTTYKSLIDVVSKVDIDYTNTLLVIDEIHNIVNNDPIIDYVNKFDYSIGMTATYPLQLNKKLTMNIHRFTLNYDYMIKHKKIVDCEIVLPCITIDGVDTTIDDVKELSFINEEDKLLALKVLFLTNVQLMKGVRKTIVFCSSKEECKRFNELYTLIMDKYQGILNVLTRSMTCECDQPSRKDIINDFSEFDGYTILTCIRILKEGVNIVKCDSEFITNITDYMNEINLFQACMRGNRYDKDNIHKLNLIMLWADDNNTTIDVLSSFKKYYPTFDVTKRIKHMGIVYDRNDDIKTKEQIDKDGVILIEGIDVKFKRMMTIVDKHQKYVIDYYIRTNKLPNRYNKNRDIKYGDRIFRGLKEMYKINRANIEVINLYTNNNMKHLLNTRVIKNYTDRHIDLITYIINNDGKCPTKSENRALAILMESTRQKYKKDILNKDILQLYESHGVKHLFLNRPVNDRSLYSKHQDIIKFIEINNRKPSLSSQCDNIIERKLAKLLDGARQRYKLGLLDNSIIRLYGDNNMENELIIDRIHSRNKKDIDNKHLTLIEFIKTNNRIPQRNINEVRLSRFLDATRQKYKKGLLDSSIIELYKNNDMLDVLIITKTHN